MARVAAVELGLVPDLSAQIGLFHDIGKGLDYSWGQRHPERGKAFLQHHACDQKICDGVASHHSSCPHTTFESMLIPPLDALSAKGCIKRLMHHNSPFKKLQHSIETLPFVKSAWCVDAHNKILLIIRLRDHSFDIVQLEETISQEKLFLPLDVQIYPHHTTPSTNAPIKTLIFFPEKN